MSQPAKSNNKGKGKRNRNRKPKPQPKAGPVLIPRTTGRVARAGRAPARAYFARPLAAAGNLSYLLRSMVLPAEGAPQRLTNNGGYPTVVTKYGSQVASLLVTGSPAVNLASEVVPGVLLVLSRQPSRLVGYSPLVVGSNSRQQRWFFPTDLELTSMHDTTGRHSEGWVQVPSPSQYAVHPDYPYANINSTEAAKYDTKVSVNEDITLSSMPISPVGVCDGLATLKTEWVEHIATDAGKTYMWLDMASMVNFTIGIAFLAATASGASVALDFRIRAFRWDGAGHEDDDYSSTNCETTITIPSAAGLTWQEYSKTLPIAKSGYYRLETTGINVIGKVTGDANNPPTLCGFRMNVNVTRPDDGIYWTSAPEMLQQPLLYQQCRSTAVSFLVANRTAEMYRGGTIRAVSARDEQAAQSLLTAAGSLAARSANKPMGYNGDLRTGLYHWMRPGKDDTVAARFMNAYGSPVYHLDRTSTCAVVHATTTSTTQQELAVFADLHIESEVTLSQSYGRQRVPTLSTADYERALAISSTWDVWHENPTHIMDYLKKIGAGAWKAFQFAAPHLIAAATSANSGGTPAMAIRAALSSLL